MECAFCGYFDEKRNNVYGTFCPKCEEFNAPQKQSELVKDLTEKKRRQQEEILEYLKKKPKERKMPIEMDSYNVDFVWRFNPGEGQEIVSYVMRFHKTPAYGETVSFLDENNQVNFSLPADFFQEISGHIAQYRGNRRTVAAPKNVPGIAKMPLSVPKIGGRPVPVPIKNQITTPDGKNIEVNEEDISGSEDTEAPYLPPGHDAVNLELDPNDPVFSSFTSKPSRSPISEAEILQAREKAKNNPNRKEGIKRLYKNE